MKDMRKLWILVIVAFCFTSCSELLFWKKEEISVYQTIKIETEEGSIEYEITDKEPARIDPAVSYFWTKNRSIQETRGDFGGQLLHGTYEAFNSDGSLKEKGVFKYGLRDGIWKTWDPDQLIESEYQYSKGKKNGPFREYEAGNLMRSGTYVKDQYNGKLNLHADPAIEALVYKQGVVTDTVFQSTQ